MVPDLTTTPPVSTPRTPPPTRPGGVPPWAAAVLAAIVPVFALGYLAGWVTARTPAATVNANGANAGTVNINRTPPEYLSRDVDFEQFWDVWEYAKNNYVDSKISDTQLFYGALKGMVEALDDPYSVFLEPDLSEKFQQELSGSFEGIGAEIGLRDDRLTIIAPLPGNPAELAGLQAGDLIVGIDDTPTAGMSVDRAVSLIRGPRGTKVKLEIFSEGDDDTRMVTLTRERIQIHSVTTKTLDNDVVLLTVKYFNEDTLGRFRAAAQQISEQKPKGIVLDLRNNPGGFLDTALAVAGEWVGERVVLKEQFRDGSVTEQSSNVKNPRLAGIPTVVLVNEGSASASEIVAGALQDHGLAKVVGETSFGKGSVQDFKEFSDASAVKLTIAYWLTPSGRVINDKGIAPDVEVTRSEEDILEFRDPQLDSAVGLLLGSTTTGAALQ